METVKIKLTGIKTIEERECIAIECWYDPHLRLWTLYPVDAEGNQLWRATYAYGKADAMATKQAMEAVVIGRMF